MPNCRSCVHNVGLCVCESQYKKYETMFYMFLNIVAVADIAEYMFSLNFYEKNRCDFDFLRLTT